MRDSVFRSHDINYSGTYSSTLETIVFPNQFGGNRLLHGTSKDPIAYLRDTANKLNLNPHEFLTYSEGGDILVEGTLHFPLKHSLNFILQPKTGINEAILSVLQDRCKEENLPDSFFKEGTIRDLGVYSEYVDFVLRYIDNDTDYTIDVEVTQHAPDIFSTQKIEASSLSRLEHHDKVSSDYRSQFSSILEGIVGRGNSKNLRDDLSEDVHLVATPKVTLPQEDENGVPLDPIRFFQYAANMLDFPIYEIEECIRFQAPSFGRYVSTYNPFFEGSLSKETEDYTHELTLSLERKVDLRDPTTSSAFDNYLSKREPLFDALPVGQFALSEHSLEYFGAFEAKIVATFEYRRTNNVTGSSPSIELVVGRDEEGRFSRKHFSKKDLKSDQDFANSCDDVIRGDYRNVVYRVMELFLETPELSEPGDFYDTSTPYSPPREHSLYFFRKNGDTHIYFNNSKTKFKGVAVDPLVFLQNELAAYDYDFTEPLDPYGIPIGNLESLFCQSISHQRNINFRGTSKLIVSLLADESMSEIEKSLARSYFEKNDFDMRRNSFYEIEGFEKINLVLSYSTRPFNYSYFLALIQNEPGTFQVASKIDSDYSSPFINLENSLHTDFRSYVSNLVADMFENLFSKSPDKRYEDEHQIKAPIIIPSREYTVIPTDPFEFLRYSFDRVGEEQLPDSRFFIDTQEHTKIFSENYMGIKDGWRNQLHVSLHKPGIKRSVPYELRDYIARKDHFDAVPLDEFNLHEHTFHDLGRFKEMITAQFNFHSFPMDMDSFVENFEGEIPPKYFQSQAMDIKYDPGRGAFGPFVKRKMPGRGKLLSPHFSGLRSLQGDYRDVVFRMVELFSGATSFAEPGTYNSYTLTEEDKLVDQTISLLFSRQEAQEISEKIESARFSRGTFNSVPRLNIGLTSFADRSIESIITGSKLLLDQLDHYDISLGDSFEEALSRKISTRIANGPFQFSRSNASEVLKTLEGELDS